MRTLEEQQGEGHTHRRFIIVISIALPFRVRRSSCPASILRLVGNDRFHAPTIPIFLTDGREIVKHGHPFQGPEKIAIIEWHALAYFACGLSNMPAQSRQSP